LHCDYRLKRLDDLKLIQISRLKVSRPGSMIQKGKNRGFRMISHRIVDSKIAQSVNTFPEFNILGSYIFSLNKKDYRL
jgi:hypothetical protein